MSCPICEKLGITAAGGRANHWIHCPAYHDENGKRMAVHMGHCAGSIEGAERCRYYIGDKHESSSVCWCELEKIFARRRAESKALLARAPMTI